MKTRTKLWLSALAVATLTACGGGGSDSADPTQAKAAQSLVVELDGDSIMYGPTLNPRPGAKLAQLLPNAVVQDKGVSGLTMRDLFSGYTTPCTGCAPSQIGPQPKFSAITRTADVVVIELGGNDAYGNLPYEQFEQELVDTLQLLKSEGRTPVVTGIVHVDPGPVFTAEVVGRIAVLNSITHSIAQQLNVADAHWDNVPNSSTTIDTVHRDQASSDNLVARLAETIRSL